MGAPHGCGCEAVNKAVRNQRYGDIASALSKSPRVGRGEREQRAVATVLSVLLRQTHAPQLCLNFSNLPIDVVFVGPSILTRCDSRQLF